MKEDAGDVFFVSLCILSIAVGVLAARLTHEIAEKQQKYWEEI